MVWRENIDNVEDFRPPNPKKQRKTLAKRFGSISDDSAIEVMKKGYVPENTKKSTSWAVGVFSEWRAARNSTSSEKVCPANLVEEAKIDELNYWLPRFINEVWRALFYYIGKRFCIRISTKQHKEVSNVMMGCVRDSHSTSSSRTLDFSSIGINNCSIGQVNIKLDKLDSDS